MNTNLIASPNVTGNIGSCTNQAVNVISSNDFWTKTITTTQTNSCTGEAQKFNHWEISEMLGAAILLGTILGVFLVGGAIMIISNKLTY